LHCLLAATAAAVLPLLPRRCCLTAATTYTTLPLQLVEELLGGPIKRPCRNRGIYSIFPRDMSRDKVCNQNDRRFASKSRLEN
jgi:hypothetical protein